MYAVDTLQMIHRIKEVVTQFWYADNASAGRTLPLLRSWWDKLQLTGCQLGYFPNSGKHGW